ncbi:MAG TPA: thioredoxin domain-containing protein [Candidatus Limnocylindrales bacterium]
MLSTLVAVALGAVVIAVAWKPAGPARELVAGPTAYAADLTDGSVLGKTSAPVVMQLYADFQCPACKQFVTAELPKLVTDYVVPGTLRIETHDIDVLGKGAADESLNLAVGAACAAEQDRYWPFHDLVFWNQGRENRGDHDAAFISSVAGEAGVDLASWNSCIGRSDVAQAVKSATAAARQAGVQYTPTLVLNGHTMVGVPSYTDLRALIDQLAAGAS